MNTSPCEVLYCRCPFTPGLQRQSGGKCASYREGRGRCDDFGWMQAWQRGGRAAQQRPTAGDFSASQPLYSGTLYICRLTAAGASQPLYTASLYICTLIYI
jgi:hypothetical protein